MFLLNLQGKEPIYEQIKTQILQFIEAGLLQGDSKLPSVRQLAEEYGINPNTVAKAYQSLEKDGYVYNLPKKGVYVAKLDTDSSRQEQLKRYLLPLKETYTRQELEKAISFIYEEDNDVSSK